MRKGRLCHLEQLLVRDLPLEVPPVHVEALWHERLEDPPAHQWLRQQMLEVAQAAFAQERAQAVAP